MANFKWISTIPTILSRHNDRKGKEKMLMKYDTMNEENGEGYKEDINKINNTGNCSKSLDMDKKEYEKKRELDFEDVFASSHKGIKKR
ncbi:unnamed protein product [Rhizophagus irregularis]|uniref:Uncharacterized protein n=1 Tax=Rhizophagus irregularis TaxID=588596 RepID=A0A2N1N827_9GLOM|nr:hypothetical protein RhiirC2_780260 [Rhizophagus irregularis]CAB4380932.1 unnamed protein product [Rhizophagus irregularis]CAB5347761.1 unnamed protein product [Rhizophagus irregularis]